MFHPRSGKVGNNARDLRSVQYSKEITAWDFNSSIILYCPVRGYC